jgi:polyisoprenoid-binding protein YceI
MSVLLSGILFLGCHKVVQTPEVQIGTSISSVDTTVVEEAFNVIEVTELSLTEDSKIGFVGSKITRKHIGGFTKFSGTVSIADGKITEVKTLINMSSVETDHPKLTEHLKTADFFDIGSFAEASFTSSKIEDGVISGVLDFHGFQNEISFPAEITVEGNTAQIVASFTMDRQLWSVTYPGRSDDLIKDAVVIELDAHYQK